MDDLKQRLSLLVLNSERLDGSQQVQHSFDEHGGTLGASAQDDWQLRDRLGAVLPGHAGIELHDGGFCLCDLSGQTYINGATSPIGRARRVRLTQGDELAVGPFRLAVNLRPLSAGQILPCSLDSCPAEELDSLLAGEVVLAGEIALAGPGTLVIDPLLVLQSERAASGLYPFNYQQERQP